MSTNVAYAAVGLMLIAFCYRLGLAPEPAPAVAAEPSAGAVAPQTDLDQWFVALAGQLGNTAPSPEIMAFMGAWARCEGTYLTHNNPFNTTQDMPGAWAFGSKGEKHYADPQQGLDATLITLGQSYPGYAEIAAGLATNDPERAMVGLDSSPWGTVGGCTREIYPEELPTYQGQLVSAPAPAVGAVASNPIGIGGDAMGVNIRAALEANGGALQHVTIAPGETWSFNASVGDPDALQLATIVHAGDGWCNLAARYAQVARAFGADLQFLHHNEDLGAGPENDVLIWNIGGVPGFEGGREDLLITNTRAAPLHFGIQVDGDRVSVIGWEG